ncbi:M1 family peptidase [Pedobacter sp. HMF7647]|uniref:M1 family peptidase n=1 Tax=Hufsiella arboris TaxID=2695275 RepID=A0A7K1YED6_9SPHI|nr:M1 family metallopeptidase [Hufsiella arboris]MXV52963.1 M1 family peptidase [Hufsiella arboris]
MKIARLLTLLPVFFAVIVNAQVMTSQEKYTRADTLRGMLTPLRTCYDINYYHLDVQMNISNQSIQGSNEFSFTATQNFQKLQFDLFDNLKVERVLYGKQELPFTREFNAVFVTFPREIKKGTKEKFTVYYSGKPVVAKRAPWDGGFIYSKDKSGNPWVAVACQGFGASCWWPTKDHQSDEVDSMLISITVPDTLNEISNGRLRSAVKKPDNQTQYNWFVANPINNYDVSFYIGKYSHWKDNFKGAQGDLSIDYWSLKEDSSQAKPHWDADVKPMLKCFEYWFGPYPFYKDGYKLVESPYLGMEHQSAVAYGNKFRKGYLGKDLSGTGHGLKWDFITVHESGHEWFGNNITSKDLADMWIHESFTNYSETLFIECTESKAAGAEYLVGIRKNIANDKPIIAAYNVNKEGSGDMYYKGANMIHTIRQLINDDDKFREVLRGLNKTFYHQTVTTTQIENFISNKSGVKLNKVFDQYLRHITIPVLEYKIFGGTLSYRWVSEVKGFDMPVKVTLKNSSFEWIKPSTEWKKTKIPLTLTAESFKIDPNFYVDSKNIK